jgi:hypothetical protein
MSELCVNLLTAVVAAIAVSTMYELWKQRHSIMRDELDEDARSLAWRTAIFLVFPFIVWLDLRATLVATEYFGGWTKEWTYGLLWYSAIPQSLPHADMLIPALFAGVAVQLLLALCLLPSLFFRPHPFLATTVSYTIAITIASNFIADPLLAVIGAGSSRWQIAYASAPKDELMIVMAAYALCSVLFLFAVQNKSIRLWFSELTNPVLAEQLRIAISESQLDRNNLFQSCRLAFLYERAGMKGHADKELKHLKKIGENSIYVPFLEGYIGYKRRSFKKSQAAFASAALFPGLVDSLRATFLAAAGCSAYANGDTETSINFSERALEFDDSSLIARMVKVDAFLRLGKKEEAGEEVLAALRRGLDVDIEDKIPLDPDFTLRQIFRFQKTSSSHAAIMNAKDTESNLISSR